MAAPLPFQQGSAKVGAAAYSLAGLCVLVSSLVSFYTMFLHLKNYRRPDLQRLSIRILWMVPVYAVASFVSLSSKHMSYYIDTIRDVYEAFVIYSFFTLLINYLGGERELLALLQERLRIHHLWPFHLCFRPMDMSDPDTFLFVRRGVLQFVILKPLLAVLIMILKVAGLYEEGYVAWGSSYVYLSFAYNLSVCWSMYCLVLFYVQCSRDLKPYRPMPKFVCVKAIIFLTFWQGLLLAILVASGAIRDGESEEYSANNISLALQDALICFEMPFFSWLHLYAFPWTDYDDSRLSSRLTLRYAIRDALGIKDLVQDTYATFVDPPDFSHPLPGRRRRQVRQHVDADHWIDNAENDLPDDDDGEDYVGGIGGRRYDVEAGGPGRARRNDSYDDITPVAASERTRFAAGPRGRLYLGDDAVDGSLALDFAAPDDEEENDYAQARELVFGDFNFPVMHEDPRFHHPPEVRRLIEHHATTFLERVASAGSRTDLSPALAQASGPAARAGGNGLLHPSSAAAGGGLREFLLSDDDDDDLAIMGAEFGDEDNADDDSALLTAHHRSAAGGVGRIPPRSQMGTSRPGGQTGTGSSGRHIGDL